MPRQSFSLQPKLHSPRLGPQIDLEAQTSSLRPETLLSTGIQRLDHLLGGGLPRGAVSEIVGDYSSGKTSLLFSILAQATCRGEFGVYIDPFDSFDPVFAHKNGIDLTRLLWIRCHDSKPEKRAAKALKAADILARSVGFGILVLDLESARDPVQSRLAQKTPFKHWFRLKRLLQGKPVTLLLLGNQASAGSAASVVLGLKRSTVRWKMNGEPGVKSRERGAGSEGPPDCFEFGVSNVTASGFRSPAAGCGIEQTINHKSNPRDQKRETPKPPAPDSLLQAPCPPDSLLLAPGPKLLRGISSEARLLRGKRHGHVTIHCDF